MLARFREAPWQLGYRLPLARLALSRLGESDFWTPMGSIGPQKSGRVDRRGRFL